MRRAIGLFVGSLLLPAAVAAGEPATFQAFDQRVEATKQAMMADPGLALTSATAAVELARRLPHSQRADLARVRAEWLHGEALLHLNRLDQAAPLIDATLKRAEQLAPNTRLHGDLLRSHGAVAASRADYVQALRDYMRALEVLRAAGIDRSQALTLQEIGNIYSDAGDYARALDYFDQSAEVFSGDPSVSLTMHDNRAEVLHKQGRFAEAAAEYQSALVQARKAGSPLVEVRILTNLASALADGHRPAAAEVAADQAMALAGRGEAAGWQPFIYGVAARVAFERGDLPRAKDLIQRSFTGVDLAHSKMPFREYHQTAAHIYEALGDDRTAYTHLNAFQRLDSEAQRLTASAASQLMSARFDFANQAVRIARLKQGQLESDMQLTRQRSRLQSLVLSAVAIIATLLASSFFSLRRSRNQVSDANAVLSEVNTRLESALKAKTDFLATTSHEIRTPLNGILGMTQILLTRRLDQEMREQIEVVHGAGETMRALVDDILDGAKMETGELQVAAEPTRIDKILGETERLWRGHAETKGLALSLALEDVPALITTDPTRLRQVVFNLISNAIKFTPSGAVAITARGCDEVLTITVADTGIGIPADQLALIFEPFHQVDGGTTRQFSGTGLGLAICRNIARALGGTIEVASEVGRGTTFTLRIPIVAAEAEPEPVTAGATDGERTQGLLLVEGNPLTQGVLHNLLERQCPAFRCVDTGDAALVAIERGRERQLLIEAKSAAMDGLSPIDSLRTLVARAQVQGMHVTVLIAPSDDLPSAEVIAVGADQLVMKPVSGAKLLQALNLHQEVRAAA